MFDGQQVANSVIDSLSLELVITRLTAFQLVPLSCDVHVFFRSL